MAKPITLEGACDILHVCDRPKGVLEGLECAQAPRAPHLHDTSAAPSPAAFRKHQKDPRPTSETLVVYSSRKLLATLPQAINSPTEAAGLLRPREFLPAIPLES